MNRLERKRMEREAAAKLERQAAREEEKRERRERYNAAAMAEAFRSFTFNQAVAAKR